MLFLPLILLLGIVTSYDDIKHGKIRNRYIIYALVASVIVNSILFFAGLIDFSYIIRLSATVLFALIIGFFIWYIGYWSAGDAKLFTAFTALIPLTAYKQPGNPLLHLIVNIFVPIFLFFIIYVLIRTNIQQKMGIVKRTLHWKNIANYLLTIFSIGWIVSFLFGMLKNSIYPNLPQNMLINLVCIMIFSSALMKLSEMNFMKRIGVDYLKITIAIALLRIVFNFQQMLLLSFWQNFIITTLIYGLVMIALNEISDLFINHVDIPLLKEGMIPAEDVIKTKKGYIKQKISSYSQMSSSKSIFEANADGLTKKDIKKLNGLYKKRKIEEHLAVQQTIPFAPFISLGALLTVVCGGSFITIIISLFS